MPPQDLETPHEASRDPIHIADENAISIEQALAIAQSEHVPLGKSTLQRWTKRWNELHNQSPVKAVLWYARGLKSYRLHGEEFKAWLFEQKENMRPHEALQDPVGSHETSQDPTRPRETSRGSGRFPNDREEPLNNDRVRDLENENMQLKIDVEVRKQLLVQARDEIERVRTHTENILRENGELQFQVRQLSAGRTPEQITGPTSQEPVTGETDFSCLSA